MNDEKLVARSHCLRKATEHSCFLIRNKTRKENIVSGEGRATEHTHQRLLSKDL